MLDLYHAQIGEGNLIELVRRAGAVIGEIQVADVPGRCEPGTGEINYPAVAAALREMGYSGMVGLEAFAVDGDRPRPAPLPGRLHDLDERGHAGTTQTMMPMVRKCSVRHEARKSSRG